MAGTGFQPRTVSALRFYAPAAALSATFFASQLLEHRGGRDLLRLPSSYFMAALLFVLARYHARKARRKWIEGIPAARQQAEFRATAEPEAALDAARSAVRSLPARLLVEEAGRLVATTPMTLWSWGTRIEVRAGRDAGAETRLLVAVRPRMPAFYDGGRSFELLERLAKVLAFL